MNGVGRLYNNEMKKMIRQTSFKVLLIILSVLIVALPVLFNVITIVSDKLFQSDNWYDTVLERHDLTNAERAYYTASKETDEFFDKNVGEWLHTLYYYDYSEAKTTAAFYNLVIAGENKDDIKNTFYNVITVEQSEGGEYVRGEDMLLYDDHDYLDDMTVEKARENLAEILKYIDQIEKAVRANDFKEYLKEVIAQFDADIKTIQDEINARSAAEPNLSEAYGVLAQNRAASLLIDSEEIQKTAYKFLYDNNISADSWQYVVVSRTMTEAANMYTGYPDYTEDEYKAVSDSYKYEFKDYSQYSKKSAENIASCRDVFARVNYALEHNIPLPEGLDNSVKETWQMLITVISTFIVLFMIIAAGMIVSSEYSSGSIRLLLVRPRKRWKILLSKLEAVTTYAVIPMIVSFVVPLVVTIAFCGAGDAFVPDVVAKGGVAREVNSIVSSLVVLAKCSVSGFMHMSFAFMLSTIVGKSALAIALPLAAQTFAGTLQTISYFIYQFWTGVKYTPLPYLDLSAFAITNEMFASLGSMFIGNFSFEIGLVYNIIITALALIIAFTVFNRKEIKN